MESDTSNGLTTRAEYDPWGLELGESDPYLRHAEPDYPSLAGGSLYLRGGNPFDAGGGCRWDGLPVDCRSLGYVARAHAGSEVVDSRRGPEAGAATAEWVDAWEEWSVDTPNGVSVTARNAGHFRSIPGGLLTSLTPRPLISMPQDSGMKAPLSAKDRQRYENERRVALNRLTFTWRCRDFLESVGISVKALAYAIRTQRPYDGPNSTISQGDAGAIDPNDPLHVKSSDLPMRRAFAGGTNALTAMFPHGTLGSVDNKVYDRSDVYYRPSGINAATIIHEALHSLLGELDHQLQERLGIKVGGLSETITQKLRDEGCAEQLEKK